MLKYLLRNIISLMPFKVRDAIHFYRVFGRLPRFKKPTYFNEKVLIRKHTSCFSDALYPILADKYLVRDYVQNKIGDENLIPLLFSTNDLNELIRWLPGKENIVIKPNHGAGMVILVNDKISSYQAENYISKCHEWLEYDFSKAQAEPHYEKIDRRILVEKKIGNGELTDYKIHLFRTEGDTFSYVLQIIEGRALHALDRTFYIDNLDVPYSGTYYNSYAEKNMLLDAIELSKKLIGDLEYARIDWYIFDNKLLFGEITLTPAAGFGHGYGDDLDLIMGKKWNSNLAPR